MPTVEEDKIITAAARADPDAQPLSPSQLKSMLPLRSLCGRPKSDKTKLLVSVRYSPEVIEYFKFTGAGWQSRIDGVLLEYVARKAGAVQRGGLGGQAVFCYRARQARAATATAAATAAADGSGCQVAYGRAAIFE